MRCVFCKQNSDDSKSAEHIIPESLGNTTQILRPGIVCDKCNNYFAREIEKPFLDSPAIRALRFHQFLPNKRGVIHPMAGIISPGHPAIVQPYATGPVKASVYLAPETINHLLNANRASIILPAGGEPPTDRVVSRFLAKVSIEALAQRFVSYPGGLDYLIDEPQFDAIRNYARRGDKKQWPHYTRRIYDVNKKWIDEMNASFQVVHEYDFLWTNAGELYLVLAIFGLELTINVGGPDIDGYIQWLDLHNQVSPLYYPKDKQEESNR